MRKIRVSKEKLTGLFTGRVALKLTPAEVVFGVCAENPNADNYLVFVYQAYNEVDKNVCSTEFFKTTFSSTADQRRKTNVEEIFRKAFDIHGR